jgi:spore photoproduct lyase
MSITPDRVFIDQTLADEPWVSEIIERLPGVPVSWGTAKSFQTRALLHARLSSVREKILFLQKQNGPFIRPCPGTQNYLCCGYQIIDFAANCTLGCHYCILQAYLNLPYLVIYANLRELLSQMDVFLARNCNNIIRLGTGEFTDSLLWDKLTNISNILIPLIGQKQNAFLELKTKTTEVDRLMGLPHAGRVVIAWSVNSRECIRRYEEQTATLDERIGAAVRVREWGYRIGFHFDPLIYYPGWEEGYLEAIRLIFEKIDPAVIAWISLGCLRFMPGFKALFAEKYPQDKFIYEEFIPGADKKLRYFKPIRIKMYRMLYQAIRDMAPRVCVYLCMESPDIWQEALGFTPARYCGLKKLLDDCLKQNR